MLLPRQRKKGLSFVPTHDLLPSRASVAEMLCLQEILQLCTRCHIDFFEAKGVFFAFVLRLWRVPWFSVIAMPQQLSFVLRIFCFSSNRSNGVERCSKV